MLRTLPVQKLKPLVHVGLLLPLAWLLWKWFRLIQGDYSALGANPIEYTNRFLGDTALRILLFALAITPLRDLTGNVKFISWRRMVGLYAFFYVCIHLLSYLGMDLHFSLLKLFKDIEKRTYITLGITAFTLLVPLALTSTKGWIRRLSPKRWNALHKLVYAAGVLACLHYFFMVKGNQPGPWWHAGILVTLLGWRAYKYGARRLRAAPV